MRRSRQQNRQPSARLPRINLNYSPRSTECGDARQKSRLSSIL
jgi:hypothetical protein